MRIRRRRTKGAPSGGDLVLCGTSHPDPEIEARIEAERRKHSYPIGPDGGCGRPGNTLLNLYRCLECGRFLHNTCAAAHFARHQPDTRPSSLETEIGLLRERLRDLRSRVTTGESADRYHQALAALADLKAGLRQDPPTPASLAKVIEAVKRLEETLTAGGAAEAVWQEIQTTAEAVRRLIETSRPGPAEEQHRDRQGFVHRLARDGADLAARADAAASQTPPVAPKPPRQAVR